MCVCARARVALHSVRKFLQLCRSSENLIQNRYYPQRTQQNQIPIYSNLLSRSTCVYQWRTSSVASHMYAQLDKEHLNSGGKRRRTLFLHLQLLGRARNEWIWVRWMLCHNLIAVTLFWFLIKFQVKLRQLSLLPARERCTITCFCFSKIWIIFVDMIVFASHTGVCHIWTRPLLVKCAISSIVFGVVWPGNALLYLQWNEENIYKWKLQTHSK